MPEICKPVTCDFTFPILETESLGNSLSSINFNFKSLDKEVCWIEDAINRNWNPAFTVFSENSAKWIDAWSITHANSACWQNTYNTVHTMSGFWLKPITMVYPRPFSGDTDINIINTWVTETFPVKNGSCFNYIVGQELIIHSPEYATAIRKVQKSVNVGARTVYFDYYCDCIGRGSFNGYASSTVDCGQVTLEVNVTDQYVNKFIGIRYIVESDYGWSEGTKIFG